VTGGEVAEGAIVGLAVGAGSVAIAVGGTGASVGLAGANGVSVTAGGRAGIGIGVAEGNSRKTELGMAVTGPRTGRGVLVGVGTRFDCGLTQPPTPDNSRNRHPVTSPGVNL
jgi:hypothetical protein